jgi:hypothetical protein
MAPPATTEIAAIIREAGIPFHTDAAKTVGKISTAFEELGVDLLSVARHSETDALNHRTTTGPKIRQTGTRVPDKSRYRRLAGRIIVLEIRGSGSTGKESEDEKINDCFSGIVCF